MSDLTYTRPHLYPKQSEAFFHGERYGLTEASTKAGKTVAAIAWLLEQAFAGSHGQNFWWVAPISEQAKIAFNRIKAGLTPGTFTAIGSPTPSITLINGAIIPFKSGDNPDSLYGEDVYAAVVDEASRVKEESWHALRSTLTATQGPVNIIGNVKGRKNWFYRLARLAERDGPAIGMHYSKITVLDAIAAGIIPQNEIEDARRTLPESVFNELYMAEPSDDSGNPFGLEHIRACTTHLHETPPAVFGVDLAKKHDWVVVIGLDSDGKVCVFQRWRRVPWSESIRRIHSIVGEDVPALVDSTGLGDPVLESLQVNHGNFLGFHFSPASKQKLMEGLAVSIQSHEIEFPPGPITSELESFEYIYTKTGVQYSAPDELHDDCVCALALARQQFSTTIPGHNITQFYSENFHKELARRRAELTAPAKPESLPWLPPPTPEESLYNELHELYTEVVSQYRPEESTCHGCKKPMSSSTRVTDGEFVWHVGCH